MFINREERWGQFGLQFEDFSFKQLIRWGESPHEPPGSPKFQV